MVWPDCEALTIIKSRVWRDFCWNLQGEGHRQRSRWKERMKVYLYLMCEKVIDHGLGTMKLNVNYTFDLETWNLQGPGSQTKVQMETTHQGLSTFDVWKSHWPWSRYNKVICQLNIWPWNFKHSRSSSQTKVPMETTHQGLSTSDVWKSYWPWSKYNEFKRQLHIWPLNLEPLRSRSQTKVPMETTHEGLSISDVWKSYWPWSRYIEVKHQLHIWHWNLEHSRSRQQIKVTMEQLIKVYLHLKCERVIDHSLGTMKLNANYTFDLETWNFQGQGHRQRKELIKVYIWSV